MKIFLSYSHKDEDAAKILYDSLKTSGFSPWLDKISLLPGQLWEKEIEKAIRESNIVVLLLSSNSLNKKGYFNNEIKQALDIFYSMPTDDIFLIPVRLDECIVPDELAKIHWVDLFNDWNKGFAKLYSSVQYKRMEYILKHSIEELAPITDDIKIIKPDETVKLEISAFSGHWIGRWGNVLASHLVVETINNESALVVYSAGDHSEGLFKRGCGRLKAQIDENGKLRWKSRSELFPESEFIFEINLERDLLFGVFDVTSWITMTRKKT